MRPAGVSASIHHDVTTWLFWEAELLDERRFREWLSLLADDIRYRMPVTVTTMRRTDHVPLGAMTHFDEDRYSLREAGRAPRGRPRLDRGSPVAGPPLRDQRTGGDAVDGSDDVEARSYLLLYRSRGDDRPADVVSVERTDRLRPVPGGWLLAARHLAIDEAVLRTQNLALFL